MCSIIFIVYLFQHTCTDTVWQSSDLLPSFSTDICIQVTHKVPNWTLCREYLGGDVILGKYTVDITKDTGDIGVSIHDPMDRFVM